MAYPTIAIGAVSNLYSRMMHFKKAGDIEQGHAHKFDHLTLLASGSLKIKVNEKESTFTAPNMIFIKEGEKHELTALEDNTVAFCIHALRTDSKDNNLVTHEMIPNGIEVN